MKLHLAPALLMASMAVSPAIHEPAPSVTGDYLEVRTCDVYTGPCFANAEMGLAGKECILVWSVREGDWKGQTLDGLKVMAVVSTGQTLGDLKIHTPQGKAVLYVDAQADAGQHEALVALVREQAGPLIREIVSVQSIPIESSLGTCEHSGCARVQAGHVVEIETRCLGDNDHLCGNEETFYPPLTKVAGAVPAFTEMARFTGRGLNQTWQATGQRSAFIGTFSR